MTDLAAKARSRRLAALEGLETRKKMRDSVSGILPPARDEGAAFKSRRGDDNIFTF